MATFKDFRNNVKPNWCPGCGDFSVQAAIQRAAANVGLEPENLAVVSGIGCSGRISGYINAYGFHGIHGRALPIAQGVEAGQPRVDGHRFRRRRRRLCDRHGTYGSCHSPQYRHHVYCHGQPNLRVDQRANVAAQRGRLQDEKYAGRLASRSTLSPLEIALAAGATFVAQSFSSDLKQLTALIEAGT